MEPLAIQVYYPVAVLQANIVQMGAISLFSIIPKWVWTTLIIMFSVKYCLWILTGINITYFNPLKFKFSFTYKDIVEVKNIQIIPLQRKIIVSGLNVNKLPANKKVKQKTQKEEEEDHVVTPEKLLNEITVPKWVLSLIHI